MGEGYNKIFWGLFITTFKLTIGMLTILPAFIGWILILSGISELKEESFSGDLSKPRIIALILIFTSLLGGLLPFVGGVYLDRVLNFTFYPLITLVLEFVLFQLILEESVENFRSLQREDSVDFYIKKDRTYILLMGIAMVLLTISLITNYYVASLSGIGMVLLTTIYLLTVIYSLSKEDYGRDKEENSAGKDSSLSI